MVVSSKTVFLDDWNLLVEDEQFIWICLSICEFVSMFQSLPRIS